MCVLILTGLLVTLVLLSCPCFCFNLFLSSSSELKTQPCALLVCNVWRVLEPAGSHCTIVAGEPFVFLLTHLKKIKVLFSAHFFFLQGSAISFPNSNIPAPNGRSALTPAQGGQLLRETWLLPVGSSGQKDMGLGVFSSPGAGWGKERCSPRQQVERWVCKARAVLLGQDDSPQQVSGHARGSYSPRQGSAPVLPAPPVFLPKASYLS